MRFFYKLPLNQRKYLSIAGGFLLYMVSSSSYIYGEMYPYLSSYIRENGDKSVTTKQVELIAFFDICMQAVVVCLTSRIQQEYREDIYAALSIIFFSSIWFILSYTSSLVLIIFLFGVGIGGGKGLFYLLPLYNGQRLFPAKKGTVGGIIFTGFAFGPFIWNGMLYAIVNPENKSSYIDEETGEAYFTKDVIDNFPKAMRIFSFVFLILGLLGSFMLFDSRPSMNNRIHPENEEQQNGSKEGKGEGIQNITDCNRDAPKTADEPANVNFSNLNDKMINCEQVGTDTTNRQGSRLQPSEENKQNADAEVSTAYGGLSKPG